MARYARLVVVLLLLMPILVFAQPRHARLVTVSYPSADSDALNTDAMKFTSCGTCQTGDLVYGLVFGQANTDFPMAFGTPAMGDPGGFDGTWINRFPNLPSQNGYLLRSVSSMSNETQDTPFNVVDGMDATCDMKAFLKKPNPMAVKPVKSKKIAQIDDSGILTTSMGKKNVHIDCTIKATNPRTVHGEIFQVDLTKGNERIVIVRPGIVGRQAPSGSTIKVTVDFEVTDGKLFPPGDYVVRLGTFLPNDFDTVTVTIPK
jgi:hypothetical protein